MKATMTGGAALSVLVAAKPLGWCFVMPYRPFLHLKATAMKEIIKYCKTFGY